MNPVFLIGAALLIDTDWRLGHGLLIEDGRIAAVLPAETPVAATRQTLPPGSKLTPGLIDIQVNGGGGWLFNDAPTQSTARNIAAAHRALGTTAILPTLITDTPEIMRQAANLVPEPESGIIGLHFEGPFLSREKPGVHNAAHIRIAEEADIDLLGRAAGKILLTFAPECVPDTMISRLAAAGIILALGHTAASYERTQTAIAAGASGFTHLFNAMPAITGRRPGVAAAALSAGQTWCGIIADGIHVHPALLRLAFAARPGRMLLVSDAMPPTGTNLESFQLQGQTIHRRDGALRTCDGTLAGADICLADAIRYCTGRLGLPDGEVLAMATAIPADFLGLAHEIGRLNPGLRADLTLFSPGLTVLGTWLGGAWQNASPLTTQAA